MSNDIFGYNRNVHTKSILSGENCVLDFGDGKVSLLQQAELTYSHKIDPVYEVGSADVYFVNGGANGSLTFQSVVGRQGFFDGLGLGSQACGALSTLSITAVDTNNCGFKIEKNNAIRIEGALLQQVTLRFQVGNYQVAQGGNFVIGKVSTTTSN